MEFGAHLPLLSFADERRSLSELVRFTESARDLGYSHLCANDHLVFSRPWLDGPTALAAVLGSSGDMNLMTSVTLPVVRGPAALAKTLGAISLLSGNRLIAGLGPGSSARDYELVGVDFEERWPRFEEAVRAMRAHWTGADPHSETFYPTSGFDLEPKPEAPGPPIWLGSWGSAAGLRRVARLGDGWLASGYNTTPADFATGLERLGGQLEQAGRDPATFPNGIATMWMYVTEDQAAADQMLEGVLAPMLNRPLEELKAKLPIGPAEACAEKLAAYSAAGAQRIFLWPIADEIEQLEVFQEIVAPRVVALAEAEDGGGS